MATNVFSKINYFHVIKYRSDKTLSLRKNIYITNWHKLSNGNNAKVSDSCLPNTESVISSHNKKVLNTKEKEINQKCDCRNKDSCPLEGKCLEKKVIYRCNINSDNSDMLTNYIRITENTLKEILSSIKIKSTKLNYQHTFGS